jgi:chromatin remodeling complex protein RSC6
MNKATTSRKTVSKSSKSASSLAPAPATAHVSASATKTKTAAHVSAPAPETKTAAPKTKTAAKVTVADVDSETVSVPATVSETAVTVTFAQRVEELIRARYAQMDTVKREIAALKRLLRDHQLEIKEASKRSKRKKQRDNSKPRKPSGFAEPVMVSDALYNFLSVMGVKKGVPIARTEVTKHVIEYIKQKNLQNPEHRREIVPDSALGKLLGPALEHRVPEDESTPKVYSYLKLQKYLSAHFPSRKNLTNNSTVTSSTA